MSGTIHDDDYVANLLTQEAKSAKKQYELVGLDAFSSKRARSGAPKPNTNFLRHIIRQTDNHNAALLAREAEESNARLREMNRQRIRGQRNEEIRNKRKAEGRLTPVLSDEDTKVPSRRTDHRERISGHDDGRRKRELTGGSHTRRHRSRSREMRRDKRKREVSNERPSRRSEHDRERHSRRKHDSDKEEDMSHRRHKSSHRHKRRRSSSTSSSSSRSRHPRVDRNEAKRTHQERSGSHHHMSHSQKLESRKRSDKAKRCSPTPHYDSDPLEAIVGPLPPSVQPIVRSRGRGANKASSMGMDSRFSSAYDPSVDTRPASDAEGDWDESLEAFRDRQRWKQQGAERLKAAGFTDAQVRKWEKGDEKDEEDVTWTKRGQAREWDRGKVVDEDGDVALKAEWGRLK